MHLTLPALDVAKVRNNTCNQSYMIKQVAPQSKNYILLTEWFCSTNKIVCGRIVILSTYSSRLSKLTKDDRFYVRSMLPSSTLSHFIHNFNHNDVVYPR